jgi:hypothetical protein
MLYFTALLIHSNYIFLFFSLFSEVKGTSPYAFSDLYCLEFNINMWVIHMLVCLGRVKRQIYGGNRLSRD